MSIKKTHNTTNFKIDNLNNAFNRDSNKLVFSEEDYDMIYKILRNLMLLLSTYASTFPHEWSDIVSLNQSMVEKTKRIYL